jgi:hypothetical protein
MILSILQRAIWMLLYPKATFARKEDHGKHFWFSYVFVLSLIPAMALFFELAWPTVPGGGLNVTSRTILLPLLVLALIILTGWLTAWLIKTFARRMAHEKSLTQSLRVVFCAMTPILLSYLFTVLPWKMLVTVINIFAIIYACILLLVGISTVIQPDPRFRFWLSMLSVLFLLFFLMLDGFLITLIMKI